VILRRYSTECLFEREISFHLSSKKEIVTNPLSLDYALCPFPSVALRSSFQRGSGAQKVLHRRWNSDCWKADCVGLDCLSIYLCLSAVDVIPPSFCHSPDFGTAILVERFSFQRRLMTCCQLIDSVLCWHFHGLDHGSTVVHQSLLRSCSQRAAWRMKIEESRSCRVRWRWAKWSMCGSKGRFDHKFAKRPAAYLICGGSTQRGQRQEG
jgi:hypothetical protein